MVLATFTKDPDAETDYTVDWTAWLAGDTIVGASWLVPAGLVVEQQSHTAAAATVWLSGGADGGDYRVTSRVVTAAGRRDDRTFLLLVRSR